MRSSRKLPIMFSPADSSSSSEDSEPEIPRQRGVKRGVKRGSYKRRVRQDTRLRIVLAAEGDEDWQALARANDVPVQTAYGWIRRSEETSKPRGGYKKKSLNELQIQALLNYVEENPLITLQEIKTKAAIDHDITLSTTTIHNYLHCQMYTTKKVLQEPDAMNSPVNKEKRREYVQRLMDRIGQGKSIIFIDETNFNLFLRRSQGRSRKGTRCSVKSPASKGKNLHIIGAISQEGLVYIETRRGPYKKEDCCEWLRRMLRNVTEPLHNVIVVCDNAPVHCSLETVFQEEEFSSAELLRAAPYSAPINPIEECWSVLKSHIKRDMASRMPELLAETPRDLSKTEFRMRVLEEVVERNINCITPRLCLRTYNHIQRHFSAILDNNNLAMGDQV